MRILFLIALFFLSSGITGVFSDTIKGPCGGFNCNPFVGYSMSVNMEREFPEEQTEAISYTEVNISDYLDGWYNAFTWQLTKTVIDLDLMETPITPWWVQALMALIIGLGLLSAVAYATVVLREEENLRLPDK